MIRYAFLTVTDRSYFAGTLATINSVLEFQKCASIIVVVNESLPLTDIQFTCLEQTGDVVMRRSSEFLSVRRTVNAWELKALAAHALSSDYDAIIGIDSDCLLCSNVDDEILLCVNSGEFIGGKDSDGVHYDEAYRMYGFTTPAYNPYYMSTSLYFCPSTQSNQNILKKWADCCSSAIFNNTGLFPGHGDQGVLNALLFAENRSSNLLLLKNSLWSQHNVFWRSTIVHENGIFVNYGEGRERQRSFHCDGEPKFWDPRFSERVSNTLPGLYPYCWFLTMLFFGECSSSLRDPLIYFPGCGDHLTADLMRFMPIIHRIYPRAIMRTIQRR